MQEFYESFYTSVASSAAHGEFCKRVFGQNLCQHGFADMAQLDALLGALALRPQHSVLDVGCGNGMIAEYISHCSGCHITGLDYSPIAIEAAKTRTAGKNLTFTVGDINAKDLRPDTYDAIISIDSIYFSNDYTRTIGESAKALRSGGKMGILYSYGREPWVAKEDFPVENLAPEHTPLGVALTANGLTFTAQDFTQQDYENAKRRKAVLNELRPQFEAEQIMFIWENRMGDANGVMQAFEEGLHARYLYTVT
jgi:cyclopropane fatty-acyl-phospholipid synthase-like methyltransferase